MRYLTKQQVLATAQAKGSTAKTYRGAAKYLIAAAANRNPLHKRGERVGSWHRDASAKKNYLRRERCADRCTRKGAEIMAAAGLWAWDDALEAASVARQAELSTRIIVPLGTASATELRNYARAQYPRRQNWESPEAKTAPVDMGVADIDCGRYSSRCRYTHYTYRPYVGSWARLEASGSLAYYYGACWRTPSILPPPHGYRWDRDSQGLRLVSASHPDRDYHPDSDDLRNYARSAIRGKLLALAAKRKEGTEELESLTPEQWAYRIKRAIREGVKVCLVDALKAGNCLTGTMSFVGQHHLDPRKHYRPDVLMRVAGDKASRVRLVIIHAISRNREEIKRGYALLADHYRDAA